MDRCSLTGLQWEALEALEVGRTWEAGVAGETGRAHFQAWPTFCDFLVSGDGERNAFRKHGELIGVWNRRHRLKLRWTDINLAALTVSGYPTGKS